uniref:Uncharacterized protein n=1 Tax=Xenopsylla cheopis TaxID=163159 RepID=A0A6M2DGK6_XENCH
MVDPDRKINNLTDEHRAFLAECEVEFADRYTEKDNDYKIRVEAKDNPPPIVDPWEGTRKKNYDNHNRNERGRGGGRYNNNRGYFRHRGGRYNNNRAGGGGYQGQNSYYNHRGGHNRYSGGHRHTPY